MTLTDSEFEAALTQLGTEKGTHFGKFVLDQLRDLRRRVEELEGCDRPGDPLA
jgi:hypothetical protein